MIYISILKKYSFFLFHMAGLLSWVWFFPLFGSFQKILFLDESSRSVWNTFFLLGLMIGFLYSGLFKKGAISYRRYTPVILFTNILIFGFYQLQIPASLYSLFISFLLGLFTACFFANWGASLVHMPAELLGRIMSLMIALACILLIVLIILLKYFHSLAIIFLLIFLSVVYIGEYKKNLLIIKPHGAVNLLPENIHPISSRLSFWISFTLVLLCNCLLSGIVHHSIFPLIWNNSYPAQVIGPIFYGGVALAGGYLVDTRIDAGKTAIFGLIFLGLTFLFYPLAVQHNAFITLQIMLESSYSLIDLFIWYMLAVAAYKYNANPLSFYGIGLFINIFFIFTGLGIDSLLTKINDIYSTFYLAIMAGGIILIGIFPALYFIKMDHRLVTPPKLHDITEPKDFFSVFTAKEAEIVILILNGIDYNDIQVKQKITKNTLKTHIRNIFSKTEVKNRSEFILKYNSYSKCPSS